ncbi:MAG: hypothetical protein EBY52_04960 [Actinobacteria bacterium]|nr:hypothetical protein [Actinomycetota bacterium]
MFGHSAGLTFAAQIVECQMIDNPSDFGYIIRGLMVFGYQVINATAVGTAVVATAVGALPELIGDLLDLANPSDLNLGPLLAAACEDPTVPAAITGRLQGLTWTAHADAMIELYQLAANS